MPAEAITRRRRVRRAALLRRAARARREATKLRRALRWLLAATLVAAVLFVGAGVQYYRSVVAMIAPAEDLSTQLPQGGARVYDRHGELLYEFVDEESGLRRPVPLSEIAQPIQLAVVATEDASFHDNSGINLRGLLRAGAENLLPFATGQAGFLEGSGGSSITQQLAKNVFVRQDQRAERSLERKLRELVIAVELTDRYTKDQILEWYLNSISFGGQYVGIEAAAQGYFGKPASELTLAESALLAGIPQAPARYYPLAPENLVEQTRLLDETGPAKERQRQVLRLMVEHGAITVEQADKAGTDAIAFERKPARGIEAPHFVLGRVAEEINRRFGERAIYERGLEVTTTLDLELQRLAEAIIDRHITERGDPAGLHNGALVALDPKSGQLLAYVGSRDYFDEQIAGANDNAAARNAPGSTLKPFGYMLAFMQGWGTGTAVLDVPLTIANPTGGEFTPTNPTDRTHGPIRADRALGNSLNIAAIRVVQDVGVHDFIALLRRAGYTTLDSPEGYGPALITGGGEVTLLDQVFAYSLLAGEGVMRGQHSPTATGDPATSALEPVTLLRVEDQTGRPLYEFDRPEERRIADPEYAYLVSHVLENPENFCLTYSSCDAMQLANGFPAAAKTGTSEPFADSNAVGETWTIGYTPDLVAGIWAGNTDNAPIQNVTSTGVALPMWKEFMTAAIERLRMEPRGFERPDGIVELEVCWPSGRLPTPHCPQINRYTSLYAAKVIPEDPREAPELWDSWWQPDGRLVLPAEEVDQWDGLLAWSREQGVRAVPGTPSPSAARELSSPDMTAAGGSRVSGSGQMTATTGSGDGTTASVPGQVTVGLTAQEDSTVRVTVDGVVAFDGVLSAGEGRTWAGDSRIQVWTNRGRTLLLSVNGEDRGPYSPAMGHPEWNEIDFGFTAG